ncbi:hypothetical protein SAMN04490244_104227 [Tranquillimonas rosea]|uniref:Uncharacterized protein n=1 Tax=Tranquillimonas rosea TaxID=641238 RepID=A0A1H9TJX0_9RHOB|nr:hypothetical protein [Tranquillimonas rosea]SER97388.1 hypothetical protein SAMN04490244_104227 [Tranquillimonas rosea]
MTGLGARAILATAILFVMGAGPAPAQSLGDLFGRFAGGLDRMVSEPFSANDTGSASPAAPDISNGGNAPTGATPAPPSRAITTVTTPQRVAADSPVTEEPAADTDEAPAPEPVVVPAPPRFRILCQTPEGFCRGFHVRPVAAGTGCRCGEIRGAVQ